MAVLGMIVGDPSGSHILIVLGGLSYVLVVNVRNITSEERRPGPHLAHQNGRLLRIFLLNKLQN